MPKIVIKTFFCFNFINVTIFGQKMPSFLNWSQKILGRHGCWGPIATSMAKIYSSLITTD